jgi:hypothetical protein
MGGQSMMPNSQTSLGGQTPSSHLQTNASSGMGTPNINSNNNSNTPNMHMSSNNMHSHSNSHIHQNLMMNQNGYSSNNGSSNNNNQYNNHHQQQQQHHHSNNNNSNNNPNNNNSHNLMNTHQFSHSNSSNANNTHHLLTNNYHNRESMAQTTSAPQNANIIDANLLQISINQTMVKESNDAQDSKPYTEYLIQVTYNSKWSVSRKYKEFTELHRSLQSQFPTMKFPESALILVNTNNVNYMNSKRPTVIEERRKALQKYLRDLAKIDLIRNSLPFRKFLELEKNHDDINADKNVKLVAHPGSAMNSYRESHDNRRSNNAGAMSSERKSDDEDGYPPSAGYHSNNNPQQMERNYHDQQYNSTNDKDEIPSKDFSVKIDKRMFTQSPNSFLKNWQENSGLNNKENKNPRSKSVSDNSYLFQGNPNNKILKEETESDLNAKFQQIDVSNISLNNPSEEIIQDRSRGDMSTYYNQLNQASPYKGTMPKEPTISYKETGLPEKMNYYGSNPNLMATQKPQFKLPINDYPQTASANNSNMRSSVHNRNVSSNANNNNNNANSHSYYDYPQQVAPQNNLSNTLKSNSYKAVPSLLSEPKYGGNEKISYKSSKNVMSSSPISPQKVRQSYERTGSSKLDSQSSFALKHYINQINKN